MTVEKKHESAGFVVGVFLLFIFMMSADLIIPNAKPLLALPVHLAYSLARALFANILLLVITRWINLRLDHYIPWYPNALKRLIIQGIITILVSTVIISGIVVTLIAFVGPYANKEIVIPKALIFSNIFALTLTILYTGVYFFNQWGRSLADVEQLKREHLQSQFNVLKQQLNPHFLFNSFSTLTSLLSEDTKRASDFIQRLSNVYRYILQATNQDTVKLEAEIHAVQAYAYLQQTRFGESLLVNIHFSDDQKNLFIAPLTLQILLENAIKHNIISTDKPLHVDISIEGNDWLVVKNNLQKKSSVESGTQVGLKNIVNRYRILSNRTVEILEEDSEFIVRIPLFKEDSI
jgi:two-component system LytT family sensor kinase